MRERILKNQVVVFGRFNFPPVPDVTVSLLQAFAPLGFMPAMVQQIDQNGQFQPRISLSRADATQIIFSNERIDFFQSHPTASSNLDEFLDKVQEYLNCLQSRNLQFNRIAIVKEILLTELNSEEREKYRERFLPNSPIGSTEWVSKWAKLFDEQPESININFEITRIQGLLQESNRLEHFDGLKILHDVGTAPESLDFRFNSANVLSGLHRIKERIERQVSLNEF